MSVYGAQRGLTSRWGGIGSGHAALVGRRSVAQLGGVAPVAQPAQELARGDLDATGACGG